MLIETMKSQGVDSFAALVAAAIQGSTETTFYVLAVYFGAVGIQRARGMRWAARCWPSSQAWWRPSRSATGSSIAHATERAGRIGQNRSSWMDQRRGFHVVLEDDTIRRIAAAAGATMVCAVLLAVIMFRPLFGRRRSRVGGTLLVR